MQHTEAVTVGKEDAAEAAPYYVRDEGRRVVIDTEEVPGALPCGSLMAAEHWARKMAGRRPFAITLRACDRFSDDMQADPALFSQYLDPDWAKWPDLIEAAG